jgi:tripartite-type tricarboxylate transporter receptor subunit TctC
MHPTLHTRRAFLVSSAVVAGLGGLAALGLPLTARAQGWPAKPLRFVVPLAPGGSADLLSRLVAQHMSQAWGQPVVVDLRPGGGTVIGSQIVAAAPPDGYTLLFAANSLVINAKVRHHLPYDGLKAFEPVALMVNSPQVLAVRTDHPQRSLAEWLSAARARPGELSLCSLGPATTQHIAAEQLQRATGIQLVYVPYGGGSQAVTAVLGGHVDSVLGNLAEIEPHLQAGTLRALAVTTAQRLPSLPQLPTVAESGYPGFEAVAWFGVAVPAGTPQEVIRALAGAVDAALKDDDIRRQLLAHGLQPAYLGPADFAAHIAHSFERYSQLIDAAGITAG